MSSEPLRRVVVADTLDLVERAKLGINGLMGTLDPDLDYECYFFSVFAARPAYMIHWSGMNSGVLLKYPEAMPLLRAMTGSQEHKDVEEGMLQAILRNAAEDGLVYDRVDPRRPWVVGIGYGKKSWVEDYASLACNGRLIDGLDYYYQMTGDETWKRQMKRTAERILALTITKGDYAYYPNLGCGGDFNYPRVSGWVHTNEPEGPQGGAEGATNFYQAQPIRGLTRWYKHSGDERMLDLCRRLTRFVMKPRFWGGMVETDPVYGATRAHWWGHPHGTLASLRALLEYGMLAEDYEVKQFVRDGYEWMRQHMSLRLGLDALVEGCTTGDLVALGVQLSDAGMGDYWDDVDAVVRNSLCEAQASDLDLLRKIGEEGPERPKDSAWGAPWDDRFRRGLQRQALPGQECTERVLERSLGGFACLIDGRYQWPFMMTCCTANGNQGWYFAWEAIVRQQDGVATINLLLNRFSPWLDIASCMPYEGKVVISNKGMRRLSVRVPGWVKRSQLRWDVDGRPAEPTWAGNYAQFDGLGPAAVLTMQFPLETETLTVALPYINTRHTGGVPRVNYVLRGSTCIGIGQAEESVRGEAPPWYPLFHRPKYQLDRAPLKEVDYYIAEKPIRGY